ncbi:MAG: HEAT repeat domain-containing protein [Deltaproteobacteria bacterium]|nr:HEAT repeat domain-containing protein [Deltaproteobacteria bacterium]
MTTGVPSIPEFAQAVLRAEEPYRTVGLVVGTEIAVLLGVSAAVLLWFVWKGFLELLRMAVERRYGIYVMEASIERLHEDSPILRASLVSRAYLRGHLLSKILRIGGPGRRSLADLYTRMGFLDRDAAGLSSMRWWQRVESCVAIGLAGRTEFAARVGPLLDDSREAVRIAAARALSRLEGAAAVPAIVAAMGQATEWGAARMADMIAGCGAGAFEHVKAAVESSAEPVQRARLIDILGAIGDTRAIPILLGLMKDADSEIRIRAAKALGVVPDRRSAVALARALGDDSWEVRAQAAKSLGRVGDPEMIEELSGRLDDRNWWVRFNSAHALAAMGEPGRSELQRVVEQKSGFARDIAAQVLDMSAQGVLEQ